MSRDAFAIFDSDRDGFIDIKELLKISNMMGCNMDVQEIEEMLKEADSVIFYTYSIQSLIYCVLTGWKWKTGL